MPKPISFEKLDIHLTTSMESVLAQPDTGTPFKIALIGDFSGRQARGVCAPGTMRPVMVDRDNVDELIDKLAVQTTLYLAEQSAPLRITFSELDDFHPDALYGRLDIFKSLRTLRRNLSDPDLFAESAAEVKSWLLPSEPTEVKKNDTTSPPPPPASDSSLLDEIVTQSSGRQSHSPPAQPEGSPLSAYLKEIVAPHLLPKEDPKKDELIDTVDGAISQLMQTILHHPSFQLLESAWRGVDFLVRRIETGVDLQIYLCDMSKEELATDLMNDDVLSTSLYRYFIEQASETLGGTPWALIAGHFHFEPVLSDIELLERLSLICRRAGAPFVSGSSPHFLGCQSLQATPDPHQWQLDLSPECLERWESLRNRPESSFIGLCLPGFLLRLPYGEATAPIDMFDFEECDPGQTFTSYLWANPSLAVVLLLAESFSRSGWAGMGENLRQDITNLPLHIYKEDGESKITPCAEIVMTERAAAAIIEKGPMPLLSFMDQDKIRLGRFQSISSTTVRLAGRWN